MADQENKVVEAAKTVGAISSFFNFLKDAAIVLFMMLMERSKIKEEKAKDGQAKAESDKTIVENELKIEKENNGKTSAQIVDDFLNDDSSDTSQGADKN